MTKEPEPKDTASRPKPEEHDAPGLSPMERMTELTRRIVSVPTGELAKARKKNAAKRDR